MWGGRGFWPVISTFPKMIGSIVNTEPGKAAFANVSMLEECSGKRAVSVCAVPTKAPTLCKRRAEPTKYLCAFGETYLCVNRPLGQSRRSEVLIVPCPFLASKLFARTTFSIWELCATAVGNGSQSHYYSEKGEKTGLRVIELRIVKGWPKVSAKPAGAVTKKEKRNRQREKSFPHFWSIKALQHFQASAWWKIPHILYNNWVSNVRKKKERVESCLWL